MRGGWKWVLAWARRETGLPKGRSDGLKGPVLVVNEGKEDQEKREVLVEQAPSGQAGYMGMFSRSWPCMWIRQGPPLEFSTLPSCYR
jgi:hypothetical protein